LRNTIIEMFKTNQKKRETAKGTRSKIPNDQLKIIRQTDAYEILNDTLINIFSTQLQPHNFDPSFNNYLKVDITKGNYVSKRFKAFNGYSKRDIMVEGSGFLQWLSVYTFLLDGTIDCLLLDEADAHLHCSLQTLMIDKLREVANLSGKQVLMASHSTEIVKYVPYNIIYRLKGNTANYLEDEKLKVGLLAGLGTEYSPLLNKVQKTKRMLLVENSSDAKLLEILCLKLNLKWPENLVVWPFARKHSERKQLVLQLKNDIDTPTKKMSALSLVDRDTDPYAGTNQNLSETGFPDIIENNHAILRYRKWRRNHIENYLINPLTLERVLGKTHAEVLEFLSHNFGIAISGRFTQSNISDALAPLFDYYAKTITDRIERDFQKTKYDIANEMSIEEIPEDIETLIKEIIVMCN
jgi:hypothetical protein